MMPDEKEQLLALLEHADKWCRHAEALDANGCGVVYDDDAAVAWDITGALCRLFGWQRACVLFGQLERHILGKRRTVGWPIHDTAVDAMAALQEFNDRADTTFDALRERIEAMPRMGTRGTGRRDRRGWCDLHDRAHATHRNRRRCPRCSLDKDARPA